MITGGRAKLLLDNDFTILDGDDGFYALSGYTREEFITQCGNKCRSNMQGIDHNNLITLLHQDKSINELEFRIYTKNSDIRWLHAIFDVIGHQGDIPVIDGLFYDITRFKTEQYEKSIIYDNIPGAVVKYLINDKMDILEANSKFYELLGTTPYDYKDGSIARFTDAQKKAVSEIVKKKTPNQEDIILEYKTSNKVTGKDVWIHWEGKYVGSQDGYPVYLAVLIDISYQKQLEQELEKARNMYDHAGDLIEIANKDPLTGLDNRSTFRSKVELYRHSSACRDSSALLMLDLDGFKNVNDTCGHLFGDDILCSVSAILKEYISNDIFAGRFGGDEFLIFIKHADYDSVCQLAARINDRISGIDVKQAGSISGSIGGIITEDVITNYRELVRTADEALYEVKISGKNNYLIKKQISCELS